MRCVVRRFIGNGGLQKGVFGGFEGSLLAFFLTAGILAFARQKAKVSVLLFDRIIPGSGAAEIILFAAYAALLARYFLREGDTAQRRLRIWTVFSIFFFTQALLGLTVSGIFLMTGKLHVPVPALIIGGPLYRGTGFFMPILFAATLLLVGSAWCSHLCYFGAWDNRAALRSPQRPIPGWMRGVRYAMLALVVAGALLLRWLGAGVWVATGAGIGVGVAGAGVMALVSRKRGSMIHCACFCPLGLVANLLGKLSPFRMRLASSCTACGACASRCRYGALTPDTIRRRRPGLTCSLCGDCIPACRHGAIGYRFPGLSPERARALFIVLAVSLHASFLAIARL